MFGKDPHVERKCEQTSNSGLGSFDSLVEVQDCPTSSNVVLQLLEKPLAGRNFVRNPHNVAELAPPQQ
jgi:hypothetical protein